MSKTERISVNITRIDSPTKFWLKLEAGDYRSECVYFDTDERNNNDNLTWIKEQAEWKCHLAFLVPIDIHRWSLTAIDKFKAYVQQFEKLAITIPNSVNSATRSTAVILWGSGHQSTNDSDALEAEFNVWQNVNVKMIFQGLARTNVHIDHFDVQQSFPMLNDEPKMLLANHSHPNRTHHLQEDGKEKTRKRVQRWQPAPPCRTKEFAGIPVHINKKLEIFAQELENQKLIELMSNELTDWHKNRTKNPSKFWRRGDICVALRCSDGKYHRAEIQRMDQKHRKCLVQFVDFGCTELVAYEHLSTHTKFVDVPIQARKFYLPDVILISEGQTVKAVDLCNQLIGNQTSTFYIHDNIDSVHIESIACSVQSLKMQLDLSSLLISHGLVQYKPHLSIKNESSTVDTFQAEKRIRKKSDEPMRMESSKLLTIEDFEEFYEDYGAETPVEIEVNTAVCDDDNRIFEIFKSPSRRNPLGKTAIVDVPNDAHPFVDRITEHFSLLNVTEPTFYCRPVYIMDPITILVEVDDAHPLPIISPVETEARYFPLKEHTACIAFENYAWHRGIVWEKVSTNKYLILFVDTLNISEVNRKLIQTCPTNLLGSKLQFSKIRLGQIKPNARWRARDICGELSDNILNKDVFAKVIGVYGNGVLDVKLYETKGAKRPLYSSLIKKRIYKKIY